MGMKLLLFAVLLLSVSLFLILVPEALPAEEDLPAPSVGARDVPNEGSDGAMGLVIDEVNGPDSIVALNLRGQVDQKKKEGYHF